MGTCIGLRNIRYFVCFLVYTALHGMITFLISLAYFTAVSSGSMEAVFGGSSSKSSDDADSNNSTGRFLEDKEDDKN